MGAVHSYLLGRLGVFTGFLSVKPKILYTSPNLTYAKRTISLTSVQGVSSFGAKSRKGFYHMYLTMQDLSSKLRGCIENLYKFLNHRIHLQHLVRKDDLGSLKVKDFWEIYLEVNSDILVQNVKGMRK